MNIQNLIPGMQNIDVTGTILKISKKTFIREGVEGQLCSVLLGDSTGTIRIVLWNNEIEKAESFRQGDNIRVTGFIKQGSFGPEIRVGRFGTIEMYGEGIKRRVFISEMTEEGNYEIRAGLVHLFESNPFYEICSKCNASLKEEESSYICNTHGVVEPEYAIRISGIIDDGNESIRCVMFKENAEKILGVNANQAKDIVLRNGMQDLFKRARYGEYVFNGKLKRNKFFNNMEFVVNRVKDMDVKEEIFLLNNNT